VCVTPRVRFVAGPRGKKLLAMQLTDAVAAPLCAEVTSAGADAEGAGQEAGSCQPVPCPAATPWSGALCACAAADAGTSHAECRTNTWKLVDLRADPISNCTTENECIAVSRGCCAAYSEAPAEYVGIHDGADRALLACFPIPPCVPPAAHADPIAYCADDGHCAVRRR
jgi:hypothetical protein